MEHKSFSLQIGSLIFGKESISYILFGLFLIGFLVGTFSVIHLKYPTISIPVTILLLFAGLVIPAKIITKGIQKATDLSER